jgi:hypothetical protein
MSCFRRQQGVRAHIYLPWPRHTSPTVSSRTPTVILDPYAALMEFLLLWWDDLDDLTHACRHLATSAFSELAEAASAAAPLATGLSALVTWALLRFQA